VCVRYLLVEGNSEELNGYTQQPEKRKDEDERWMAVVINMPEVASAS
jgi:hypothetical protein